MSIAFATPQYRGQKTVNLTSGEEFLIKVDGATRAAFGQGTTDTDNGFIGLTDNTGTAKYGFFKLSGGSLSWVPSSSKP